MESPYATSYCPSYLTSSWVGPTLPSLTEVLFLLFFPLCLIVHGYYFPCHLSVFSLKIYNCFTACFTVEFTIAPDTPIYDQYQAVFFACRARRYISEKSAWGRGYMYSSSDSTPMQHDGLLCFLLSNFFFPGSARPIYLYILHFNRGTKQRQAGSKKLIK